MRPINSVVTCPTCHRRNFLRSALAGSAALFTVPGALAEALTRTPDLTRYVDRLRTTPLRGDDL